MPKLYPIVLNSSIEHKKTSKTKAAQFSFCIENKASSILFFPLDVHFTFYDSKKEMANKSSSSIEETYTFSVSPFDWDDDRLCESANTQYKYWLNKRYVVIEIKESNGGHQWHDTLKLPQKLFGYHPSYHIELSIEEDFPKEKRYLFEKYRKVRYVD